ncbi:MAG: PP2C family protein-serine/threonine phosphatase [Nitrospirae bacterium]|nr:PP2C family protein-serine/threonine phosphatase [Fimbriimonadaceae bacterium]
MGEAANELELARLEREMDVARRIQHSFLPKGLPQPDGWQIAADFIPAREVAGDFYDAFPMANGRRIGLIVADVCDKGVGAALFMALMRSMLRAFAQQHHAMGWMGGQGLAPARGGAPSAGSTALLSAIELTNRYIAENHGESGMFASVFFGVLDPGTGALNYINAGHNPPYIFSGGTVREQLGRTGPVVGLFAGAKYEVAQAKVEPGELLFLFTDGVPEARNEAKEFFEESRLIGTLDASFAAASDAVAKVRAELGAFVGDAPPHDDVTMMAVLRGAKL